MVPVEIVSSGRSIATFYLEPKKDPSGQYDVYSGSWINGELCGLAHIR